jgi:hypothetical protein
MVTTSFQGQVTVTDLASQRVVWSEDSSSTKRPQQGYLNDGLINYHFAKLVRLSLNHKQLTYHQLMKIDIDGDPTVAGQFMVTTSFQGQVTVTDLASQRVELVRLSLNHKQLTYHQLMKQILYCHKLLDASCCFIVGDLDGVLHLVDPATGKLIGRSKTSGEVNTLRVI